VSFGALKCNIARTASLLRTNGIGKSDVVAVLMPAVPAIYWSILGAMTAAVAFPVNWMLEPKHILRLLKEADVKAIVALGPTPGFQIWDSLLRIAAELPAGTKIWSVAGPDGTILPDNDLVAAMERQPDGPIWSDSVTGDDIGAFVHSGGTTGLPKIVKLSHRNMSYRHWTLQLAQQLVFGEVILHDTPMFSCWRSHGPQPAAARQRRQRSHPNSAGCPRQALHRRLLEVRGEIPRHAIVRGANDACGVG
jgi:fatty-acyl-CoA synthase